VKIAINEPSAVSPLNITYVIEIRYIEIINHIPEKSGNDQNSE
jgi:hypothetical protein